MRSLSRVCVFWERCWGSIRAWLFWRDTDWPAAEPTSSAALESLVADATILREAAARFAFEQVSRVGGASSGVCVYGRIDGDNAAAIPVLARRCGCDPPADSRRDAMSFGRDARPLERL